MKHIECYVSRFRYLLLTGLAVLLGVQETVAEDEELYVPRDFTPPGGFEFPEGPAVDDAGFLYAVNIQKTGTIAQVTPEGEARIFVELPNGSAGNGIRFDSQGMMCIADYINHNILRVDMQTQQVSVHAHEPTMNQPNDIAIGSNDMIYASDPNWTTYFGRIWRIDPDGTVTLLEDNMGTTNGIEVGPGDNILYVNESVQRRVWAYDLSSEGEISNKRLFTDFTGHGLDGMRCDVLGNLYITRFNKGVVAKFSPAGELLLEISLTGQQPTNIAFGGPDGRTCYVTMGDRGNIETFRAEHPGRSWQLSQARRGTAIQTSSWGMLKNR